MCNKLNSIFTHLAISLILFYSSVSCLQCYECGEISFIPSSTQCRYNTTDSNHVVNVDTCTYGLNDITLTSVFSKKMPFEISVKPVCYTLEGKFRGEAILMRGCDAMPFEDEEDSGSGSGNVQCLDGSDIDLWFETEVGQEGIEVQSLCLCDEDFCNELDIMRDSATSIFEANFITFLTLFLAVIF